MPDFFSELTLTSKRVPRVHDVLIQRVNLAIPLTGP